MVRMELNCFVEKSSSLKRDQVPYLLMNNEFMCDTLVTGYVLIDIASTTLDFI